MVDTAYVSNVSEATFQTDVVPLSKDHLVLVDFWAPWCGPCQVLGPVLEQLAEEYGGVVRVAKVNTDEEERLGTAFNVQSLPTVVALFQGQPVHQFMGALPKDEVRRFIDQLLDHVGLSAPEPDVVPEDTVSAARHWEAKLEADPKSGEALLALGRIKIAGGPSQRDEGKSLLERVDNDMVEFSAACAALNTIALMDRVVDAGGENVVRSRLSDNPNESQALFLMGCLEAALGDFSAGLARFVDLVALRDGEVSEEAKKVASIVFEAAGREDPQVEALRRRLAQLLF
jgi:putative thioredoxin